MEPVQYAPPGRKSIELGQFSNPMTSPRNFLTPPPQVRSATSSPLLSSPKADPTLRSGTPPGHRKMKSTLSVSAMMMAARLAKNAKQSIKNREEKSAGRKQINRTPTGRKSSIEKDLQRPRTSLLVAPDAAMTGAEEALRTSTPNGSAVSTSNELMNRQTATSAAGSSNDLISRQSFRVTDTHTTEPKNKRRSSGRSIRSKSDAVRAAAAARIELEDISEEMRQGHSIPLKDALKGTLCT